MALAEYAEPVYSVFGKASVFIGYDDQKNTLEHVRMVNDTDLRLQITCRIVATGESFTGIMEPRSPSTVLPVPSKYKTLDPFADCAWSGSEVQR